MTVAPDGFEEIEILLAGCLLDFDEEEACFTACFFSGFTGSVTSGAGGVDAAAGAGAGGAAAGALVAGFGEAGCAG